MISNSEFRTRLKDGEKLVGTFVKTPHPAIIEILATVGLDFLVLDAEHAPIGREGVDLAVLAARAAGIPLIVRVPVASVEWVQTVLDSGAAGIMVPRVGSAAEATAIAVLFGFGQNGRGFSPSTRAAGFGQRTIAEHLARAREDVVLVVQIEDPFGVEAAAAIAAVPGVDCLFVGPVDLAVANGATDPNDPDIVVQCDRVIAAAKAAGKAGGMFVANSRNAARWLANGARFFVVGTDQGFLKAGAAAALKQQ
jgi:2-keto-3-deoxy-L-rhamnonate aldolase RhmA